MFGIELGAIGFNQSSEPLGRRKSNKIAGDKEPVVHACCGELDFSMVAIAANKNAYRGTVSRRHRVRFPPIEIKVHLPGIRMAERANLKIQEHVAAQEPVVKDQIDIVMLVGNRDALLTRLEAKARSQFEEERLQMIKEAGFQVVLCENGSLSKACKLQQVRIAQVVLYCFRPILVPRPMDYRSLILGQPGALVEQGTDLPL